MITIKTSALKAAMICSAQKDMRTYLNTVMFRVTEVGNVYIAGCDGHRLFLGKLDADWTDIPQKGPFDILIPFSAVKTALQGKKANSLTLSAMPDGRYCLGDTIFTPTDGKYPDVNRVIPDYPLSGEVAQFNIEYLADAQKALRIWTGNEKAYYAVQHNGPSSGVLACETAFVVVMCLSGHATEANPTFKSI